MTHYLLSLHHGDVTDEAQLPPGVDLDRIGKDVDAFHTELMSSGAGVFAGGLHPSTTATVVQEKDGQVLTTDGPYLETKEHLGGFSIIAVDDLDAALEWGAKLSAATGLPVEVRPFHDGSG